MTEVVGWIVSGFLMALLVGWASRDRLRPRPAGQPLRMVNPPSMLVMGLAAFLFFLALLLLSTVWFPNESSSAWVALLFIVFASMGLWMILAWLFERIDVSPAGMRRRTPLGTLQAVAWADIEALLWSPTMKWLRVEGRDGAVLRISAMLTGWPELAQALLALAAHARMDEETRGLLRDAARGELPPIGN